MADQITLEYHQPTFSLLNELSVTSAINLRKIERWESQNRTKLPAAIREWYSLEGSEDRLRGSATEDFYPLSLQKALNRLSKAREARTGASLTRFELGYWGTGAVSYARMDGTADPVVDWGSDEKGNFESFSAFAFARAWSRQTQSNEFLHATIWGNCVYYGKEASPDFPLLQADESTFDRSDMSYLAGRLSEGIHRLVRGDWREGLNPFTNERLRLFGPVSIIRFFSTGVRVQILCQGNPVKHGTEAHWDISADSESMLVDVVGRHLWQHRMLASCLSSPTHAGKASLRKLRRKYRFP